MIWTDLGRYGWDWQPMREMRRMRNQMNRLLNGFAWQREGEYPAVNIHSNNEALVLTAELPGVEAGEVDISVQGNTLTLRGSRPAEELKEGESYHRQERGSGSFVRTLELPFEVEAQKVEAQLDKGILRVSLPRCEKEKPRKIEIKSV